MNATQRNRVVGLALLVVALIWSVLVYTTIPAGQGASPVGPRAFPLLLGIILAALSALMIIRPADADEEDEAVGGGPARDTGRWLELQMAGGLFLLILLYAFLMEKVGFLIATAMVSVIALAGILKVRKPRLILFYSLGVSVGSWIIFGKLLGAYLPLGSWISFG